MNFVLKRLSLSVLSQCASVTLCHILALGTKIEYVFHFFHMQ